MLLLIIIYQDFRYRAVSWVVIPLMFAAFAVNSILTTDVSTFLQSLVFNIGFIFIQLLAVTAYFCIKYGTFINITAKYIGWGDIWFLTVVASVFSPVNFIVFYVMSLLSILIIAITLRLINRNTATTIPLAGAMALILLMVVSVNSFNRGFDFQNDQVFLSLLISSI